MSSRRGDQTRELIMSYERILEDLKSHFGEKKLLSPKDIAPYISRSTHAQQALRKRNRFPIPTHKFGGKVVIKIYDLARYLSNDIPIEEWIAAAESQKKVRTASDRFFTDTRNSRLAGLKLNF